MTNMKFVKINDPNLTRKKQKFLISILRKIFQNIKSYQKPKIRKEMKRMKHITYRYLDCGRRTLSILSVMLQYRLLTGMPDVREVIC